MKKIDRIRKCSSEKSYAEAAGEAAGILKAGGIVAYPTRCLYGLGADALSREAVKRVFAVKQRSPDNPLLILVPDRDAVIPLVKEVPPDAVKIMDRFWPGRVTIVFPASTRLPANLHAGKNKIGIRLPGHPLARALVSAFGGPITGTSANRSGHAAASRIQDLDPAMVEKLDLILDAGQLQGGTGSTVVDVTGETAAVLREGSVSRAEIFNALKQSPTFPSV